MGKMVVGGMFNFFIIWIMVSLFEVKCNCEGDDFKFFKSFLYYVEGIEEVWVNYKVIE